MLQWLKTYWNTVLTASIVVAFFIFAYGCEAKVASLTDRNMLINRQELQLELDQFITMAQIRMADLDKQEKLRAIVLQNALILVQGQPYNPLGIISAVAAVYGLTQGGRNIGKVVKTIRIKQKGNNSNA